MSAAALVLSLFREGGSLQPARRPPPQAPFAGAGRENAPLGQKYAGGCWDFLARWEVCSLFGILFIELKAKRLDSPGLFPFAVNMGKN